jgi:hypothetical protein
MRPLAAIWLVLVAGQAARLAATGSLLSGDDVFHFAHLLSLVVDRDLDARNEVRHFQHDARSSYTRAREDRRPPAVGLAAGAMGARPHVRQPQARQLHGGRGGGPGGDPDRAAATPCLAPRRPRSGMCPGGLNVVAMWLWSTGPVGPLPAADTW